MIAIVGSSGFLGSRLSLHFKENNIKHIALGRSEMPGNPDFSDHNTLFKILDHYKPSLVINCVAETDLQKCEIEPKSAIISNVVVPFNLSKCQDELGFKVIQISTDHFYDKLFSSEDNVVVLNQYAATKLQGEQLVANENTLILRTNFFGMDAVNGLNRGLVENIISKLCGQKEIIGFQDVLFNPLYFGDLIKSIDKIILNFECGTFNIGSTSYISKAEFVKLCITNFQLDLKLFKNGSIDSLKQKVKRPNKMVSSSEKAIKTFDLRLPSFDQTFVNFVNQDRKYIKERLGQNDDAYRK